MFSSSRAAGYPSGKRSPLFKLTFVIPSPSVCTKGIIADINKFVESANNSTSSTQSANTVQSMHRSGLYPFVHQFQTDISLGC